jgi:hypothetical protein
MTTRNANKKLIEIDAEKEKICNLEIYIVYL